MTPVPPPVGPGEIDMNEIARLIRAAGVPAYVQHVGGGGAVVNAGHPGRSAQGDAVYPATAGPGRFLPDPEAGWAITYARGRLDDFYLGPDELGGERQVELRTAAELGVATPAQAAAVMIAQVQCPDRGLTVAEGRAAAALPDRW